MILMKINNKTYKRIFTVFLSICLTFSFICHSSLYVNSTSKTDSLKNQLSILEQEQKSITKKINQIKKNQNDAQEQLDAVNELIDNLSSQIDLVNNDILSIENEMSSLKEQIDDNKNKIIQRLRAIYISGGADSSYLMLLDAENAKELVMIWSYLDFISEYETKAIALFNSAKEEYDIKKEELEIQKSVYNAKIKELDIQKKEAKTLVDKIAAEKKALEEQQKKIDAEMDQAREELNALIYKITADTKSSEYVGGSFIWPLRNDRNVSSKFGTRWGRLHAGIDAGTPVGTPVYAANAGTVVTSGYNNGGYGHYIIINHGGGKTTVYAHLSTRLVEVGDIVEKDQLIAKSGNTGRSTGPHLHFEIRINGVAVNPLNYVKVPR